MTTSIMRWDPFAEFAALRRSFGGPFYRTPSAYMWRNADTTLTFPVDVSETDEQIIVKAALPGIKPDEVEVTVNDGVLTIKGETKREEETEGETHYRRELRYGAFSRSIALPSVVADDAAEAKFDNGVLTVTLPKAEEAKPKQIKVTTGATNGATASKK